MSVLVVHASVHRLASGTTWGAVAEVLGATPATLRRALRFWCDRPPSELQPTDLGLLGLQVEAWLGRVFHEPLDDGGEDAA